MKRKIISKNSKDTRKLATQLAKKILQSNVIALTGDLGAGKTTFVQGFAKALGIKTHLTSPTFLIIRKYSVPKPKKKFYFLFSNFYHIDCYRLHKSSDLTKLEFKRILENPQNIVLIEWAEKIKNILPKNTIWINFFHGKKESERLIEIK